MQPWQIALRARKEAHLEEQLRQVTMSRDYFQRRCEILESIINEIDPSLVPPRGVTNQERFFRSYNQQISSYSVPLDSPQTFCRSLLEEIMENSSREPCGRRWSLTTLMFSFVIRSLGSKAYDYIRWFVPLPCKQTLLNRFGSSLKAWSQSLLNVECVAEICKLFRRRHQLGETEIVNVGLGIDAMSMEPTMFHDSELVCNHVFLFQLLPLSGKMKPIPIHILPQSNGNAGKDVIAQMHTLVSLLTSLYFVVRFVSTDGDRGYDHLHHQMYSKWKPLYNTKGLDKALESLDQQKDLIVGDLLHLLKNARSKLFKGKISIFGDGSCGFDASDVEQQLHLGAALTDYTSKGRMRDVYVLEIFRLENVQRLFQLGQMPMALYILPYAMWVNVVINPGMSCQQRREFLSFVINLFVEMECITACIDHQVVSINKHEKGKVQFAFSDIHLTRALNTLLVQLYEIERNPDDLAMDRIGTHVLECQFGMIRLLCHHKHSWKMILRAFSRSLILEDLSLVLGHSITIRERVNVAGTKISNQSKGIYINEPDICPRRLWEAAFAFMLQYHESLPQATESLAQPAPDIFEFSQFISEFIDTCAHEHVPILPRLWHGSNVSNSTILARLIAFCHRPSMQDDAEVVNADEHENCTDTGKLCEMLNAVETPGQWETVAEDVTGSPN